MSIERYTAEWLRIKGPDDGPVPALTPNETGEFVLYADHIKGMASEPATYEPHHDDLEWYGRVWECGKCSGDFMTGDESYNNVAPDPKFCPHCGVPLKPKEA